jgi:hypothetical protein
MLLGYVALIFWVTGRVKEEEEPVVGLSDVILGEVSSVREDQKLVYIWGQSIICALLASNIRRVQERPRVGIFVTAKHFGINGAGIVKAKLVLLARRRELVIQ